MTKKTKNKKPKPEGIIWLDRGWQPVSVGFCPTERDWKHEVKTHPKTFKNYNDNSYPTSSGAMMHYPAVGVVSEFIVIFIHEKSDGKRPLHEVVGLITHEVAHAWQWIRESIGEKAPGRELEAYAMQSMVQECFMHFMRVRGDKIKWPS